MKEHYYLDNASTTWPKPEPVYRFMDAFFRSHGVNPGRAGHTLAIEAEQMIFETRRLLAHERSRVPPGLQRTIRRQILHPSVLFGRKLVFTARKPT